MTRPAPTANSPAGTVQQLLLRLGAILVLLTLAAVGVNQLLLDRILEKAGQAWAEGVAETLQHQEPGLTDLLQGAAPAPGQLERLRSILLPAEVEGFRLLRADGAVLVARSAPPADPPRRHQAAPARLAEVALAVEPGRLVLVLRDTGRRQLVMQAFRHAQLSVGAFGVVALMLLLWLGLRGKREEAAARRARQRLRQDALTGLATHAELRERLALSLAGAGPAGQQVAVLVLNLRGFRDVNAAHGRAAGDALLAALARRLRSLVRREDTVARLSADRFAVVQTAVQGDEDAVTLAARLATQLAEPLPLPKGGTLRPVLECGVAMAPQDGTEAELLLARAEAALSTARGQPEPAIRSFEPAMDAAVRLRRETEADLRAAMARKSLLLHYQPQLRLRDRGLVGFEALLRWPHPTRGMIPPSEFIPLAEQTGLIVPLGAWVIRAACAEAATWPGELHVAVNLSPAQFRHGDLVCTVAQALADTGLPARRLELEVTESLLQEDPDDVVRLLRDLRALGVSIAMDDFGTGWSSLAHLWRFPFGKLKVDRAFVTDLGRDSKVCAILATIVGLGRILDMTVVAEGVETEDQARILTAEGCEQGQGWLFGRPMPAEAARRLIVEDRARLSRSAA
ncbi:putative bifunctional diguanylate cyclase/phosphodiesterase [Falsiroseomonas selenitidurans]|uniref:GGDEF domain-containing protein n=1 Tax=Falsiroseomonas selenitidurans TaxID=2716335 RepID=A0ABX1EAH4_9PROT|nr:bifunctional diguanylate cyclase/phosphodiesterase [Falsiroseomonas selenitidurans]NKC34220.1 GGDEF domain-containing protein [Falsiroseomonas selenitidurans]